MKQKFVQAFFNGEAQLKARFMAREPVEFKELACDAYTVAGMISSGDNSTDTDRVGVVNYGKMVVVSVGGATYYGGDLMTNAATYEVMLNCIKAEPDSEERYDAYVFLATSLMASLRDISDEISVEAVSVN